MAEDHELPMGGPLAWPSEIFLKEYALRCNLVHFETILRNVTVCTPTSTRLDHFSNIVTYILK